MEDEPLVATNENIEKILSPTKDGIVKKERGPKSPKKWEKKDKPQKKWEESEEDVPKKEYVKKSPKKEYKKNGRDKSKEIFEYRGDTGEDFDKELYDVVQEYEHKTGKEFISDSYGYRYPEEDIKEFKLSDESSKTLIIILVIVMILLCIVLGYFLIKYSVLYKEHKTIIDSRDTNDATFAKNNTNASNIAKIISAINSTESNLDTDTKKITAIKTILNISA